MRKKNKETLVEATLIIPAKDNVSEQIKHIHNAEMELAKAGVTFDSGHTLVGKKLHDWDLDWSLRGAKLVFQRFKKKKLIKRRNEI